MNKLSEYMLLLAAILLIAQTIRQFYFFNLGGGLAFLACSLLCIFAYKELKKENNQKTKS